MPQELRYFIMPVYTRTVCGIVVSILEGLQLRVVEYTNVLCVCCDCSLEVV